MIRPLLLALVLLPLAASAQETGKLAGRVVDELGDPLPGATVTVGDSLFVADTDVDGNYFIIGIPIGKYTAVASFVGIAPDTARNVPIQPRSTTQQDFTIALIPPCDPDSTYRTEDLSWQTRMLPRLRLLAEAHGIDALDQRTAGPREVRIWRFGPWGPPWTSIQMVESRGVKGDIGLSWTINRPYRFDSTRYDEERLQGMRSHAEEHCGPLLHATDQAEACSVIPAQQPDWEATLRAMEAAELWSLPDESALPDPYASCSGPTVRYDGTTYVVELFDGVRYRAYSNWSPDAESPWSEETNAARIVELFREVLEQATG